MSAAAVTARRTDEGRDERQGGSYAAMNTVRSITEMLSSDCVAADETPTRSSNEEQMIVQQESNPQRLLGAFDCYVTRTT